MCLFSLMVVFTGCFAWFVSIRNQAANSNTMPIVKFDTSIKKIELHKYYGESTVEGGKTYFGFNPEADSVININNGAATGGSNTPIQLGPYSLDDPNHPVLLLMEVSGGNEVLEAITEYSSVAADLPTTDYTVATHSALASSYNDGTKIKVTTDETRGGCTTIYQYVIPTNGDDSYFDMLWIDLKAENNPLSSVVQFHSFTYESRPTASTHSLYTYNANWEKADEPTSMSCLAFDTSLFTDEKRASFTTFVNGDDFDSFDKTCPIFAGDLTGYTYLAVVINYYPPAIEYIFSYYLGSEYLNEGITFECDWITYI